MANNKATEVSDYYRELVFEAPMRQWPGLPKKRSLLMEVLTLRIFDR